MRTKVSFLELFRRPDQRNLAPPPLVAVRCFRLAERTFIKRCAAGRVEVLILLMSQPSTSLNHSRIPFALYTEDAQLDK